MLKGTIPLDKIQQLHLDWKLQIRELPLIVIFSAGTIV